MRRPHLTRQELTESVRWGQEKQSSCFFQAKTAGTTLRRNLCFNLPRAGFNFVRAAAYARLCLSLQAGTPGRGLSLCPLSDRQSRCGQNDGLGGGDEVHQNLIFNSCRCDNRTLCMTLLL